MDKRSVLFICTHNSARSQMAEGLVNAKYGDKWKAYSGGVEPSSVHPMAVACMKEIGIDISAQRSKSINEFRGWMFNVVVTVCDDAARSCPFFPGNKIIHRPFQDPSVVEGTDEEKLQAFRRSRDEILAYLQRSMGGW
ncbi:MAG: Protein ArsC [Methanomassiliicoccales archaeon PtaU1.Bin124]|nr:MAG: Protein ArsC [Methanomassiliicoccales archaeon PtaU1.Bin124]